MRFLADESCDFAVVRILRSEGHDVLAVSEFQHRSIDRELMELATRRVNSFPSSRPAFCWTRPFVS